MDVAPAYKYIEAFREGVQWYIMEYKIFFPNIRFKLQRENGNIVFLNGHWLTCRLPFEEVWLF